MIYILSIKEIQDDARVLKMIVESLKIPANIDDVVKRIQHYIQNIRPEINIIVEDNYIDKVYRDEYYSYFSTKLNPYYKNCIKLSFIDGEIDENRLLDQDEINRIKESYLGFMILRPLFPGTVGRTALSPDALIKPLTDVKICKAPIKNSIIGHDVTITAFPHSSQDTEYMTCAETTIWSIMEYFGNKYAEYCSILPSKIHKILDKKAFQRHIPSEGLLYSDISYVLQTNSFGCKVYSRGAYSDEEFNRIFSCYIESGIPLGVAVTGICNGKPIGHAIVCIGRKNTKREIVDHVTKKTFKNGIKYISWNECIHEFVFNDDNNPCYQIADIDNPTPQYQGCKVNTIIVPLYHKIYMDAPKAINYSEGICNLLLASRLPDGCVVRTYLAYSHSYRNHISQDTLLNTEYKNFILDYIRLPKFVWVTEISTHDEFVNEIVEGIILLDATEVQTASLRPLLFGCYKHYNLIYDNKSLSFRENTLSLQFKSKTFYNLK